MDYEFRRPIRQTGLLLRAAFHRDDDAAIASWREWEAEFTLDEAYWTDMKIATAAYPRIAKAGIQTPLAPRLSGLRRFIWSTVQTRIAKALPFLQRLAGAGVPIMLTKGGARLAAEPQAAPQRYIQDIDLLVPVERWGVAVETLLAAGARPAAPIDHDMVIHHMRRVHHALALELAPTHEMDLHQFALFLNRQEGADRRLWEHAVALRFRGVPVMVPHPSHRLAMAFGHGLLFAPETAYDWVGDALAHIAQPGFDWSLFAAEVEARELIAPAALCLEYLAAEIGAPIPAEVRARLDAQLREPFITELASRARSYVPRGGAEYDAIRAAALIRCDKALGIAARPKSYRASRRLMPVALREAWTEGTCRIDIPQGVRATDMLRLHLRFQRSIAPPILGISCLGENHIRIARGRTDSTGPATELKVEFPAALLLGHGLDGIELRAEAMQAASVLRQGDSFAIWTVFSDAPATQPAAAAAIAREAARVAVVTPYGGESLEQLRACHDSVRAQAVGARHYFIAEGTGQAALDGWDIAHIRLPPIGDDGVAARGFGLQLAFNEGADVAACLDADSAYLDGHLQRCVAALGAKQAAVAIARRIGADAQADASCLAISRHAAFLAGAWMQYPREFGSGDVAQLLRLIQMGKLETAAIGRPGIAAAPPRHTGAPARFDARLYAERTGIGRLSPEAAEGARHAGRRWRIAVVTAYGAEPVAMLRRCHDSVMRQGADVTHFMIADGQPRDEIDAWPVTHIRLPAPHGDHGGTARGLGAALAFKLGHDAVAFLDADAWYAGDHVATLRHVLAHKQVDLVCSWRRIVFPDGAVLPQLDPQEVALQHVDASGLLVTDRMAFLGMLFAQLPREAGAIAERLLLAVARHHGAVAHWTCMPTVFRQTRDPRHYALAGRPQPAAAPDLRAIEQSVDPAAFSARTGRRPVKIEWPDVE